MLLTIIAVFGAVTLDMGRPASHFFSKAWAGHGDGRRLLAAQIAFFNCPSYEAVEKCIIELRDAGINTLIVRAFHNEGDRFYRFARPRRPVGVYFDTQHAPIVDPLLARIVAVGHRHRLRVFAWMETRNMPLWLPAPTDSRALRYDFDRRGLRPFSMWSIFDERVEDRLVGLFRDVARTGVDGILFQDDLIMYQYEDFSPRAIASFERETGKALSPGSLYLSVFRDPKGRWRVGKYSSTFWSWSRWKNHKLLELAHRLIRAGKEVNPRLQFALNLMYESVTRPRYAMAWLSQNIEHATKFPIDFYAVMAYHRQIKKELGLSERAMYEEIGLISEKLLGFVDDKTKILMKIQVQDWDTREHIPPSEVDEVLRRVNGQGEISLAFVPYAAGVPLNVLCRHLQE